MKILFALLVVSFANGQEYANTTNSCFFTTSKSVEADEITRLAISGDQIDKLIATCCTLCRSIFNCVAWEFKSLDQTCFFYKNVKSIYSSTESNYLGKKFETEFWKCNEQKDKWYYDNSLWVQKTNATSKESRSACCHDCFWSTGCVAWQHYESTNDCYHSTKSISSSPSATLIGMYAGLVSYSFSPYEELE